MGARPAVSSVVGTAAPGPCAARPRTPAVPSRRRSRAELVPRHVAVVMDGNGRWAKERGLPRTAGHEAGEASLLDCVHGAIELGVGWHLGVRLLDRELEALARRGASSSWASTAT